MATSSAMSTSNQYIKYTISVTQNSQSIADNTSNVTVKVRFYRTNTGYTSYGTGTVYCKINGTQYTASVVPSQGITNSGIVLFTKTLNISHGSDGTKKLTCSAWISHDVVTSSEQSYTQTLTTIYRASKPTVSATSVKMGNTLTVTTNRKSSSFTHTLKYTFGGTTANIATGVGASYSWTVPDLASECNNEVSGTATITCVTYNGSTLIGTETCAVTLDVPSKSTPSTSASSIALGNKIRVNTNRGSSNFTHSLELKLAGETISTASGVTTYKEFDLPLTLAKKIPSDTEGEITVFCITYNGTQVVGTDKNTFKVTVPNNSTTQPTASFTLSRVGTLPSAFDGVYLQGKSAVKADFTASTDYSTIASYKMVVNGKSYYGDPTTSELLTKSGTVTVTGSVTDARGYSNTSLSKNITVHAYKTPIIKPVSGDSEIVCRRCTQDGTYDDAGTYLRIRCKLDYSYVKDGDVQKNICTLYYMYKIEGGSWSSEKELFVSDSSSRIGTDQKLSNIVTQTDKSYTVRLIIRDTVGSEEIYDFGIPTADVVLHLAEKGAGVAVGKYSEGTEDNKLFECAFPARFYENVYGRAYGLGGLPSIPQNADLNDAEYREFGCSAIKQTAIAETVNHLPPYITPTAGIVRVYAATGIDNINTAGWEYVAQEYNPYNGKGCYRRLLHKDGADAEWEADKWIAVGGVDSVIESGTITTSAGIEWHYKKWFNGTAECWARRSVDVDATTAWGSGVPMYYGTVSNTSLPFTFASPPICQISVEKGTSTSSNAFFVASSGQATNSTAPSILLCRPTSATGINVNVLYCVHGLWK